MDAASPLRIEAIATAEEWPAVLAACEQLSECLAAPGREQPIQPVLRETAATVDLSSGPAIVIYSLLPGVMREQESLADTEARIRRDVTALTAQRSSMVFVSTVFRSVAVERKPSASRETRLERIRRLNLLAIYLSHGTGVGVIDIDRSLAHIGGRELETDYRLSSPKATEAAGHVIAAAILAIGLGHAVPAPILERAKHFHGSLTDIDSLMRRRLQRNRHGAGSHG